MTVENILSGKSREVVTIQPHRTLSEAVRLLAERRIGAVVVSEAGETVVGIISERDLVRALASGGSAVLDDPVSSRMTSNVVTCTRRAAINEVMELMTEGKFRHVPVVENGRLTGIVSIGDIVKQRLAEVEAEHQALREYIATA
jgi:CBS domain-containing protein